MCSNGTFLLSSASLLLSVSFSTSSSLFTSTLSSSTTLLSASSLSASSLSASSLSASSLSSLLSALSRLADMNGEGDLRSSPFRWSQSSYDIS